MSIEKTSFIQLIKKCFKGPGCIEILLDADEFLLDEIPYFYTRFGCCIILLTSAVCAIGMYYWLSYTFFPLWKHDFAFQFSFLSGLVYWFGSAGVLLIKSKRCLYLTNKRLFLYEEYANNLCCGKVRVFP